MKFLFTLLLALIFARADAAVNTMEREYLCPVCGTHWEQRIETSGQSRGLRLDLRRLGEVVDPPTLPQCTKCRFPHFSDRLVAQANDPEKAPAFKRLRTFVMSPDFQMLAGKNPSYFSLAQVQEFLGAPHHVIALSYLRASWQAEGRPAICQRLLEKARAYYVAALAATGADVRRRGELALLCGEVERRLQKWDEAERRFRGLESSGMLKGTPQAGIPALQLRLIEQRDAAPHTLEGVEVVANRPPPERALRLENPGQMSLASVPAERLEGMKLAATPKAAEDLFPTVLLEAPEQPIHLGQPAARAPDDGLTLAIPPKAPAVPPQPAPAGKPDKGPAPDPPVKAALDPLALPVKDEPASMKGSERVAKPDAPPKAAPDLLPASTPRPRMAPVKPEPAPIYEGPNDDTDPVLIPRLPARSHPHVPSLEVLLPPPMVLLLPLPARVQPEPNFSDNPD
jgi:hypothetical protein